MYEQKCELVAHRESCFGKKVSELQAQLEFLIKCAHGAKENKTTR